LFAALWGGQAGSLLFWSWLLSAFTAAAVLLNWRSERRLMPYVLVVTLATLSFFLLLNVFVENPFERYWRVPGTDQPETALFAPSDDATVFEPVDGSGLSPLLRHLGMVIHPPTLYLGFVGFTIPFAFAFAALATGQLGAGWLRATRRWALIAWLFLSLGLLLGGRWAYDVLSWGGYWGWDPVENAALLPWLTGTAFLHSAVVQEKRGMLKFWNMLLIILTFILVILGTFATRSGVVTSVHAFAKSNIGPLMFSFLGVTMLSSIALLLWRQERGDLRGANDLDSLLSRESLFLMNNWLFLGLMIVVLWGTWAEALSTIAVDLGLADEVITLGRGYYPPVVRPFLIGIYILMGVAPLAAWRRSTADRLGRAVAIPAGMALALVFFLFVIDVRDAWALLGYGLIAFAAFATLAEIWKGVAARHRRGEPYPVALGRLVARDRRRYGGYFIHLGMVIIGLGVIGSSAFQKDTTELLEKGERLRLGDYKMQYDGLYWAIADDGREMQIARVTVLDPNDKVLAHLEPRRDFFTNSPAATIPDVYSTLEGDFYVRISKIEDANRVTFRAYWNPLINFLWFGGFILIAGTMVALWPTRGPSRTAQPVTVPSGAGEEQRASTGR
jgi:cytochrome c-type biogenesis protein CcmF